MKSVVKWELRSGAMVVLSALLLSACSSTQKSVQTSSTYETDENGQRVKTTVTREVVSSPTPPPPNNSVYIPEETTKIEIDGDGDGEGANIQIQGDPKVTGYADNDRVHVRAPLVKVDADDETGSVHIKAPFVNINKNGKGDATTIRIPGITIRGHE